MEDPSVGTSALHWADVVVVAVYFAVVLVIGLVSSLQSRRDSLRGYFLASRSVHWLPIGASLFASNIGSGHFIGLAGSGAADGIAVAGYELQAVFMLVVLGWLFVPVYTAAAVYTMPEYLRLRFGRQRIRVCLSVLALLMYIFTKISADLYAGALFIQRAMRWEGASGLYLSIIILLVIAAVFTVFGGLTAVIWTDLVQTVVMVVGSLILSVMAFVEVGGYSSLVEQYLTKLPSANVTLLDSDNRSCSAPNPNAMHLFRSITPGVSEYPWTGMTLGIGVISIWYWCSDQVIVQRTLASRNMIHAKGGTLVAGVLKMLPLFLLVFPGMAARVLYTDTVACSDPDICFSTCGSRNGCTNLAYIELVLNLLPVGLSGLMLAVMLAALMSSLTSIFNSASTLFTIDIYTRIRSRASEREQLFASRIFVLFMVAISIAWIPIINNLSTSELFVYIQSIQSFLSPPISAIYVLAVFWPRTNEQGAFWGMIIGMVVGITRFAVQFSYSAPSCGSNSVDTRPDLIKRLVFDVHFMNFAFILFVLVILCTVAISLCTEPIPAACLHRLTFWSRFSTAVRRPLPGDETKTSDNDTSTAPCLLELQEKLQDAPSEWRRRLLSIGGFKRAESFDPTVETPIELTKHEKAQMDAESIAQDPKQSHLVNGLALLTMGFTVAIYVYYR